MTEPIKYAAFVTPELGKGRIDAQWARIAEQRPVPRRRSAQALPAVVIMVAACTIGMVWWPRESRSSNESVWEGSVVASDDSPVEMTLAEGTRIKVEPRSEVKLLRSSSEAVQVRLDRGSARFQVAKNRARRFSVDAGKIEVVVTGTQFRVIRRHGVLGERVRVEVDEGSVEVHRADGAVVSLHAGDHWSTAILNEQGAAISSDAQGEVAAERGDANSDIEADDDNERASAAARDGDEAGQAEDAVAGDDGEDELDEEALDEDEAGSTEPRRTTGHGRRRHARSEARGASLANAGELFDHANLARRAGRLSDAASLYAELVTRYPRDRRASLAAFELGRLRMDSLRDARGAVLALERALKLDGRGEFAEDALARLVLAQEERGDRAACVRARDRYLARYPEGVHAQHVAERCGP